MDNLNTWALGAYLLSIAGVLIYSNHQTKKNKNQLFKPSPWSIGFSIFSTYISSIAFIAVPAQSYSGQWNPFVFVLALPVAALVGSMFFIPFFVREGRVSCYEYLGERFGSWSVLVSSSLFIFLHVGRVAVVVFLLGQVLSQSFGWTFTESVCLILTVVLIYSSFGGFRAVVFTDFLQGALLQFSLGICLYFLFGSLEYKFFESLSLLQKTGHLNFALEGWTISKKTFLAVFIFGLAENLRVLGADQTLVQRFVSTGDLKSARKALFIGVTLTVFTIFALAYLGSLLHLYFQANPIPGEPVDANRILIYFTQNHIPPLAAAIVFLGIISSAMSSIDSSLNSSSLLVLKDFLKTRNLEINNNGKSYKISTLILGLTGLGVSFFFLGNTAILEIWWDLTSFLGGGLFGLFLMTFVRPKISGKLAFLSFTFGFSIILLLKFTSIFIIDAALVGPAGALAMLIFSLLGVWRKKQSRRP